MVYLKRNDNEVLNEVVSGLIKIECILEIVIVIFIKLIGLCIVMIWIGYYFR